MTGRWFDSPRGVGEKDAGCECDWSDWDRFYELCDGAIRTALAYQPLQAVDREDCCQEIWVELLATRMSRFRGGRLRPWLAALARNKAVDLLRRSRRRPSGLSFDPEAGSGVGRGAEGGGVDASRSAVWSGLAALESEVEPRSFLVFFLRWIEGWSFAEIAEVLGLTPGQARLRHHRAKEKFRRALCGPGGWATPNSDGGRETSGPAPR